MKFARMNNGKAVEVIDFDPNGAFTHEVAQMFESVPEDTGVDDTRNPDGTWTKYVAPVVVVAPESPVDMRVTQVAFKRRLTSTERIAIRTLAAANATAFDFMDLLDSSVVVHLDDRDVIGGITMFEQVGVLPAGRASVILTTPISDGERP